MVQFASYLRRVLCKTRLIFPGINGPNMSKDDDGSTNVGTKMNLRSFT